MTASAQTLAHGGETAAATGTFRVVGMFCAAGLLVSLLIASYGVDLSPGFF